MGKFFASHKIAFITALWCLWLGSLALDVTVFDEQHLPFLVIPSYGSEAEASPTLPDAHHHEHEFTLLACATVRLPIACPQELSGAYLPALFIAPIPLLPPPKAA